VSEHVKIKIICDAIMQFRKYIDFSRIFNETAILLLAFNASRHAICHLQGPKGRIYDYDLCAFLTEYCGIVVLGGIG
jgi:hypothetical protein